jgi:5-deoxy-glucuronate isomerase
MSSPSNATDQVRWIFPRGQLAREGWETVVDGSITGWEHTGLRVAAIEPGQSFALDGTGVERIVVPLSGSFTVRADENGATTTTQLAGRSSVFDGPTDVLYLSSAATAVVTGSGRFAVAESPTEVELPTRHLAAESVPVELRGAGASSREVRNFGTPGVLDAARLIVCEVVTPAGNWSSYPPHKHDQHVPGVETRLEEIYLFETSSTDGAHDDGAFGLFSAYSSPAGEIEIDAQVRPGDVALIPFGYHGPAVAAPGYDLYYLNVMAGPDPEREWLISDDPAHAWVRDGWQHQRVDSRLPFSERGQR